MAHVKILHVNTLLRGGAGRAVQRLHTALLKHGQDSHLLSLENTAQRLPAYSYFPDSIQNPVIRRWKLASAKLRHWQQKVARLGKPSSHEPFRLPFSSYDITLHPAYQEADIIHLHWVPGLLDFPSFFTKNKKPVVWTLHDMFPFSGGYHYETGFPVTAYKKDIDDQLQLKKTLYQGQNIHVVCLSEWMMRKSRASETLGHFPHYLIPNGLDTGIFCYQDQQLSRKAVGLPTDKTICLFVSDYLDNPRKGLSLLREAWQHQPLDNSLLVAIGKKTPEIDAMPNALAFGMVRDDEKLAKLYAAADLFILPSREDNLPNTVLESLCCGCPVMAFDTGGMPDMVIPGENGILVKEQSPSDLQAALAGALGTITPFDRKVLSKDAIEKFDFAIQAERMTSLYAAVFDGFA